jgi:hypothetical protein
MLSKARDLPYCIKNAPMPWPDASQSTINVFVKLGVARTRVVHIASLSFSKSLVAS